MELVFFMTVLLAIGLFIKKMDKSQIISKQDCKLHVWRYWDTEGWLTEPHDEERLKNGARLKCAMCLQFPNQPDNHNRGEYPE